MRRTIIALVAVLAVVGTACTADSAEQTTTTQGTTVTTHGVSTRGPTGERAFAASTLQPFDSCTDFLDYVKSHAIELVGPYGLDGYGGYPVEFAEVTAELDSAASDRAIAGEAAIKGVDYSGTNVQVAGVDEPDIVKTDGERIFVVAQGRLYWIDASGTP